VQRQAGRRIEALESPTEFPTLLSYVWSAFISLNNTRSSGFSGPNPITYEQVLAWKTLTGSEVSPKEVELIMKIDRVYMQVYHS